jgi:hypothetical protein
METFQITESTIPYIVKYIEWATIVIALSLSIYIAKEKNKIKWGAAIAMLSCIILYSCLVSLHTS